MRLLRLAVISGLFFLSASHPAAAPKGTTATAAIAAWRLQVGIPADAARIPKSVAVTLPKGALRPLDTWAVQLSPDTDPFQLAADLGLPSPSPLGGLADWYEWTVPGSGADPRSASAFASTLDGTDGVITYEQQFLRPGRAHVAVAPPAFTDPAFRRQFHLVNDGQHGGAPGQDANLLPAWALGLSGQGVVIGIVDDGVELAHPDLLPNIRADLGRDIVDNDTVPNPSQARDSHGTAVAGIAAAAAEGTCGVGAAYRAGIAGLRLYVSDSNGQFNTPDSQKATILSHRTDAIAIYNNSWGPSAPYGGMSSVVRTALDQGITQGRGGLGVLYVFSAGNNLEDGDNVNYNPYANRRGIIAVGAVGHQGRQSDYSEPGVAMFVTAPSSGNGRGTTTTNYRANGEGDCTDSFGGTSSAAPLVSGILALLLEARPDLTWRDVQHLLAETAVPPEPDDSDWQPNGAGYRVNPKFGFGRVDAGGLTALAPLWENVPAATSVTVSGPSSTTLPDNNPNGVELSVNVTTELELEHVEVTFTSNHTAWGDLRITLISPQGTESVLAVPFDSAAQPGTWTYLTNFAWGESSVGTWRLRVSDEAPNDTGRVSAWSLRLWGTLPGTRANRRPAVNDDTVTAEVFPIVIDPLANDTDPDGDSLLILGFERPAIGEVRLRPDGRLEYDRPDDAVGDVSFHVTVGDGRGRAAVSRILVRDLRPMLPPAHAAVAAGGQVVFDPFADAVLPVGETIVSRAVGPASSGVVELLPDQRVRYTTAVGFTGQASFDLTLTTTSGRTVTAPARITVAPGDDFAGRFQGNGGWVRQAGGGALNVRGAFTVEAWIRPRTYGSFSTGFGRIFDKSAIIFYLCSSGHAYYAADSILISIDHPTGSSFHGSPAGSIALNRWTHVAATYNGINSVRIFIDGTEVPVTRYTDAGSIIPAGGIIDHANSPLHLGDRTTGDRSFDGLLDEVRFWNVARSPAEISANRNLRLIGSPSGLVGRWSFDEGAGTPANTGSAGGTTTAQRLDYTLGRSFPDSAPVTMPGTFDVIAGSATVLDVLALANDPQGAELKLDAITGTFPAYAVARTDGLLLRVPEGLTEPFEIGYTVVNAPGVTTSGTLTVRPHASSWDRWLATTGIALSGDPAAAPDADADSDGVPNALEILLGTDPLARGASPLRIEAAGTPRLRFPRAPGQPADALVLEYRDPDTGQWRPATAAEAGPATITGGEETIPLTATDPAALYRLRAAH